MCQGYRDDEGHPEKGGIKKEDLNQALLRFSYSYYAANYSTPLISTRKTLTR